MQNRYDIAFAMADIILNGYRIDKINAIPWNMLTIAQEVLGLELKDDSIIIRTPNKAYMVPRHNMHIMHKKYLMSKQFDTFVEGIVNVQS